jgi:hypothetical protein
MFYTCAIPLSVASVSPAFSYKIVDPSSLYTSDRKTLSYRPLVYSTLGLPLELLWILRRRSFDPSCLPVQTSFDDLALRVEKLPHLDLILEAEILIFNICASLTVL